MSYAAVVNIFASGMDHVTLPDLEPESFYDMVTRTVRLAGERILTPQKPSLQKASQVIETRQDSVQFVFNSHKIDIKFDEVSSLTPRQCWTKELIAWYRAEDPAEIAKHFVHAVFHLGRGAGKVALHYKALGARGSNNSLNEDVNKKDRDPSWPYPAAWACIAISSLATWGRFSNLLVCASAASAFLASPNTLTEGIRSHTWMQGRGKYLLDTAAVTEDISERLRKAINKETTALGLCAGAMLVHTAAYHALPSISLVSVIGFTLTTATSLAAGHYLGADGLSSSRPALGSEEQRSVEK